MPGGMDEIARCNWSEAAIGWGESVEIARIASFRIRGPFAHDLSRNRDMSRLEWLRRTVVESGATLIGFPKAASGRGMRRRRSTAPSIVEALEDRTLLTAYVVNTTSDDAADASGVADGLLSLREAITAANTNAAFGDAPAGSLENDSIQFRSRSSFPGAGSGPHDHDGRTVAYIITDDLRITGPAPDVILDANGDRGFRIVSDQFTLLSNMTIRNADASDGAGGGGIRILGGGRTILSRVTIEDSTAVNRGAAILNIGSTLETYDVQLRNNQADYGGGLANLNGVVTLNQTLIEDNVSNFDGGGISNDGGRLMVRDSRDLQQHGRMRRRDCAAAAASTTSTTAGWRSTTVS